MLRRALPLLALLALLQSCSDDDAPAPRAAGGSSGKGGAPDAGPGGSGGGTGGGGSDAGGQGGTAGDGGTRDLNSYLLWGQPDKARIWTLNKTDGSKLAERTLDMTASKGTGWSARDSAVLSDGTRRLLWTRPEQGQALIWVLDSSLTMTKEVEHQATAPAQGWYATSYAKLADGTARLVWFNSTPGNASVWPLDSADASTAGTKQTYTPEADPGAWVPTAFSPAPDGTARLLWSFTTTGAGMGNGRQAQVWHLDPRESQAATAPVSHQDNWYARDYYVEGSGRVRMLWGNDTTGAALLCSYAKDVLVDHVPGAEGFNNDQCKTYGPEAGWVARSYATEECVPGSCPAPCIDDIKLPALPTAPATLAETGLYSDAAQKTLAAYARAYQPAFQLWSDGAEKARHVYLPKCAKVDTSDMDHWDLPAGTRLWKEFKRNGVLVETRIIHHFGPGVEDWMFAAYQWNAAGTTTTYVPLGVPNAGGTPHDIPSEGQCRQCHGRLVEKVLSFSAIQLSHTLPGETMASLSTAGLLSVPNAAGFTVPGTADERAALGYLHANCGNCHNDADGFIDMHLRLLVAHTTVQGTDAYRTAVNKPTANFQCGDAGVGGCNRIQPGSAATSAVVMRMSSRSTGVLMPPLASEVVDTTGVGAVSAWINAL